MTSRWQPNLVAALQAAGLADVSAREVESTREYCNHIASAIARHYLDGSTTWLAADAVINHLYPVMLDCSESPEAAWAIYLAFDAGEDRSGASADDVTKPILVEHIGG